MNLNSIMFEITSEKYKDFIRVSKDTHALHTIEKFAQEKGFKSIVVHGNLLNVFISYAIGIHLGLEDVMILNQSINFRQPIYIGDMLILELSHKTQLEFLPGSELGFVFCRGSEKVADGKILIKTKL